MSWDTTLVTMTRVLINDLGITKRQTDDNIAKAIVVGGVLLSQIFNFSRTYVWDIDKPGIYPDPCDDTEAVALLPLKAASLINMGEYQLAISTGIKVRDGDSEVDTTQAFGGYKDILLLGPSAALDKILASKSMRFGKAIVGPVSTSETDYSYMMNYTINFYNGIV